MVGIVAIQQEASLMQERIPVENVPTESKPTENSAVLDVDQ
jgi:hypothetical protein